MKIIIIEFIFCMQLLMIKKTLKLYEEFQKVQPENLVVLILMMKFDDWKKSWKSHFVCVSFRLRQLETNDLVE
jgi:hypothetical protein